MNNQMEILLIKKNKVFMIKLSNLFQLTNSFLNSNLKLKKETKNKFN